MVDCRLSPLITCIRYAMQGNHDFLLLLLLYPALTPKPIRNLRAIVDKSKPSVRLNWDPPTNAAYAGYVTKYHICFWDKEKGCYREKSVDGSTTTAIFTRETGLRPLTLSTFEVRACSGDDVSPECRTVSAFLGMQAGINCLTNTRNLAVIYSYKQIALPYSLRWSRVIYSI